ncbi:MAG: O-antigen ligase family protein [Acidobacteriaceae bacterium]|nr:O-antigen ligase family protein [Acidobacteriaceae bacterium]
MSSAAAIAPHIDISASPKPSTKRLQSVLFAGSLTLLLLAPLAFGAVEHWAIFSLQAGSMLLFIFWAFRQAYVGELHLHRSSVFLPMAAFAALVVCQLILRRTAYRAATVSILLLYGSYALLSFVMVQSLQRRRHFKTLLGAFSCYGSLVAAFALVQGITSNDKLYWIRRPRMGGRIYGPYVNHNHYAGLMEMLIPFALVLFLSPRGQRRHKALAAIAATLMASTIFICGSRGGMFAFVVQMSVLIALILSRRTTTKVAITVAAFLLLSCTSLAWLGGGELLRKVVKIPAEMQAELSGGTRLSIDRDCITMFLEKPFTGWGLGTFAIVYPHFRSFYTNLLIDKAHNDYLQLLVETGAIGGLVMLWFLLSLYRTGIKKLEHWPSNAEADVNLAALLAITGILVHSFVDFNLQIPANAALFFVLCAISGMPLHQRASRSPHHEHL